VYRTYEAARDRLVAVKLFRLDLAPEQAELFARELIRLVEIGLAHPAIVQPLAGGIEGCAPYLALEYVAAESLETALRHDAPAKAETVATLVRGLGGALDEAASRGVFHGALHPRDVYVAPDRVRATGFGLVQALERVGVPPPVRRPYTAPERIEGRAWGPPADVFSLAALAFELLTGRRLPGPGPAAGDLSGAHPEVSGNDGLRQVLAAALAEASEARYPTGEAFADAFDAAVTAARFVPPKPAAVVVSMAAERAVARRAVGSPCAARPKSGRIFSCSHGGGDEDGARGTFAAGWSL
jgi:serine/threonine protein kinase